MPDVKGTQILENINFLDQAQKSAAFLKKWHSNTPKICVVLGSGLCQALSQLSQMKGLSFRNIPGFQTTNVAGHLGELRVGKTETLTEDVVFLLGRNHAYEGFHPAQVVHNIRAMILWGVQGFVLTNAAGALNPQWELGKMMLICDHINGTGLSPLLGSEVDGFGPRFTNLSQCYTKKWQHTFQESAQELQQTLYQGIYCGVLGPQYDTPAEIAMIQKWGAHAVGMSTVLESIAACQMGAKIAALSCLTNYGAGLKNSAPNHEEVIKMGQRSAKDFAALILHALPKLEL
jgi:purine-nucleoside phosphorylase